MEEANSGDAGGPGFEAGRGVSGGDAAEGEDRDGVGEGAGLGQGGEAGGWGVSLAEDGAEEDEAGRVEVGGEDLAARVAGAADDRVRQAVGAVEMPDLRGSEAAGVGGEMDAVGAGGEGYIGAGVDEEAGGAGGCGQDGEDLAGQSGQFAGWKVRFTELQEVDSGTGQAVNLGEESVLRAMLQTVLSGGDGVAEHGSV